MFFKLSKFFLHAAVFTVVIVSPATLFPFIVGKYTYFHLAVELALVFFLLGLMLDRDARLYWARLKQMLRNPLFWAMTAFAAMFLLACAFSVRPHFSFWSNFERGEGGWQILHLYVYALLLAALFREVRDWRKYLTFVLAAAMLVVLYGVAAGLKYIDADWTTVMQNGTTTQQLAGTGGTWFQTFKSFVGPSFADPSYRFQGTIGNPAYVAAYLLFVFFDAAVLGVLYLKKRAWRWILAVSAVIFLVVFYAAGTRGAFVGLVAGAVAGTLYLGFAHRAWRKKILPVLGAILLVLLLLVAFHNTSFVQRLPGSRLFNISLAEALGSGANGTFSTRQIMWGIAWRAWEHRPLLGYGPENFIWTFDRYFDPRYFIPAQGFGAWFDRAHSVIFDYLDETGVLGLFAYLSMFAAAAWLIFKKSLRHLEDAPPWAGPLVKGLLLAMPVAYLVQGLVLFDVLTIYLGLFAYFALVLFFTLPPAPEAELRPGVPLYGASIVAIIFILIGAYYGTMLPYAKAAKYIDVESAKYQVTTEPQLEDLFRQVLDFKSPVGDEEAPKFLSSDVISVVDQLKTDSPDAHAITNFIIPYLWTDDIRHLLIRGQLRTMLWQNFHQSADYQDAVATLTKAHDIAPDLPQPMFGLAALYQSAGDRADLLKMEEEILALWPDAAAAIPAH